MRLHLTLLFGLTTVLFGSATSIADEILLEDYQDGGKYSPADWANSFSDSNGNENTADVEKGTAVVSWATKWSGLPSTGEAIDLSEFKTFQVDVMVAKDQPVEEGANFYFQLLDQSDQGYAYWEVYVPQSQVPADGKWYQVQFPMKTMNASAGDGGEVPKDFKTIIGTCCGMTYDETGDKFKFKRCAFDNVKLLTDTIEKVKVAPVPKTDKALKQK